jgi:osmotically-inducible protein OsmY
VTLSGHVETRAQHDRALALARETDGVATVVDRLTVR